MTEELTYQEAGKNDSKIKILLVDDHAVVRHGIWQALEMEDSFTVVAEANCGQTAVDLALWHAPDIVLMDVSMPNFNGIEATRDILAQNPNIKIIALSMHSEKIYVLGMLNAGVSGYVLKSCSFNIVLESIKTVLSGKSYFCPKIIPLIQDIDAHPFKNPRISVFSLLSSKERQVLQLLAEGHRSKEIAKKLEVSVRTIDVHRLHLMKKLDLHTVAELTKFAVNEGLTSLNF